MNTYPVSHQCGFALSPFKIQGHARDLTFDNWTSSSGSAGGGEEEAALGKKYCALQASKHCYRRRLARLQPGARTHVARRRRSLGHLAIFGACLAFPPWRSQGRSEHRMDGQSGGGAQMTSAPIEGTDAAGVGKF